MKQVPELYDHQKEALQFISDKPSFALFMEQGTGKSKVIVQRSYDLFNQGKIDSVIILSPNGIKPQWIEEQYPLHYPNDEQLQMHIWNGCSTKKEQNAFRELIGDKERLAVFSINIEAFQSNNIDQYITAMLKERRVFMVVDESTRIKNGRRKPARGKRAGAKRTNKLLDLSKHAPYKGILTGTPTPKNPFDLWSQFEFLQYNYFGVDYFMFTHNHGIMVQGTNPGSGRKYHQVLDRKTYEIVKSILKKKDKLTPPDLRELSIKMGMKTSDVMLIARMESYRPYKNLKKLKEQVSRITYFVKKEDCLDLPDKVYEKVYVTMGPEQRKLYKQLAKEMYAEYEGKEINIQHKLTMTTRLQYISGGLFPYQENPGAADDALYKTYPIPGNMKLKTLIDDMEEVPESTYVIIWARFIAEVDLIYDALIDAGYTCEKYYGGSSDTVITRFKAGEFQILITTPTKSAEGLNLQISTLHYEYSNTFRADLRLQSEDRSHRAGQTNRVLYKDLLCKGTVDERIYGVLKMKEDLINYFQNNRIEEFIPRHD